MIKYLISYVDNHVIVDCAKGIRVFDCVDDAVEFISTELSSCSAPVEPTQQ